MSIQRKIETSSKENKTPGESKERNRIIFHSIKHMIEFSTELRLQPGRLSRWEQQEREAWMHSEKKKIPGSGGTRKDFSSSNKEEEMAFCKNLLGTSCVSRYCGLLELSELLVTWWW